MRKSHFRDVMEEGENISIKKMRVQKCMSQKELAERMGLDPSAISLWEAGKTNPLLKRLKQLAEILDCSVDDLMAEDEEDGC